MGLAVKVDGSGNVYLTGETLSTQFPFPIPPGAVQPGFGGGSYNGDAFVAKFDNTGKNLVYFTYLGGSAEDGGLDLAIDPLGNACVAGFTLSPNFPTRNALYPRMNSLFNTTVGIYDADAFVAELNTNGSALIFSTYLGGTNTDIADGIALDGDGNIYLTGLTGSGDFPTTNALPGQTAFSGGLFDAFVTKLAPGGTSLIYSTFLGGPGLDEGQGIAADTNGFAYVTGFTGSTNFLITTNAFDAVLNHSENLISYDGFVTKLSPGGSLVYSTFLGGTNDDYGYRIRTDGLGNAYVAGTTLSQDFLNTISNVPGLQQIGSPAIVSFDAFLTKLDPTGVPVFSTVFGGDSTDIAWDLAVDGQGNTFLVGNTYSTNFPATNVFAPFTGTNSGFSDVFVTAINSNATAVLYSAYLGGWTNDWGYGIAVDAESSAYIVGNTYSTNFPTSAAPFQGFLDGTSDAFIAKIRLADPPLSLAVAGDTLLVSWPATASDFVLESATNLLAPVNWLPVGKAPLLSNGSYRVTLPATNAAALFRLRRP